MKVFSLQAPIYRGAWLSSRLTAQTSQLAAVRRDALERWRRARSRGLSAEAGCSEDFIASISGNKDMREIRTYVQEANRACMATEGMAKTLGRFPGTIR